jgi:hypothetical protein|tara:strand:+ start:1875 stop:2099 length:225 start_codon:yes stop_codon:yes gene_type:complete
MRSPDHYIAAQEQLFAKFQSRSIAIQHWSKYLMTPKELALLFRKLEKSNSVLQEIARTDLGKSGELARKQLGIQ